MNDFPSRISYAQALDIVHEAAAAHRLPVERRPLRRAHGRVLAGDIHARLAQPPFDNSAMDGYALRHADLSAEGTTVLGLHGAQFAGAALGLRLEPGQCVRITTGAPLPDGADTVVIQENTTASDGGLRVDIAPPRGANIRRAGEDSQVGDLLLRAGQVLTPSRIALCASQGMAEVDVVRPPTVAVLTTGDELVEPGAELAPGQIYNSNRELLMGLLRAEGLEPTAWPTVTDTPEAVESALRSACESFDLVITCGGVSVGDRDLLPGLLRERGRICFWKVRMKPGMPLLLAEGGSLGPGLYLGLPGNPVSVLATWLAIGQPLVDAMQSRTQPRPLWRAQLAGSWVKRNERLEFLRGSLYTAENGTLVVAPNPADGSHRMRAAADSNALIMLEEGAREYAAGTPVQVIPY